VIRSAAIFPWKAYFASAVAVVLAAAARELLDPYLGSNRPFLVFFASVAFAAWYGGLWPAIFTVVSSYLLANLLFIPPYGVLNFDRHNPRDWANLLSFWSISAIIVGSIEAMWRAQSRADASAAHVRSLLEKSEEVDRRKDEFLATLAHELRNPLAPLGNALQLWSMREPDAAESAEMREIMSRQVRQMVRLIDDLMDVSRIRHGRVRLRRAHVELSPLIKDASEAARPMIDHYQHRLDVDLAAEPIWVDADPARLTQVFTNILINAAKHSGTGRNISVIARQAAGQAVVRVSDNGVGIPTDMLAKIFEPFAQVDAGSEKLYAGLGIGLALVKQLIELHGGTVEALSAGPEKGSEFVVKLPVVAGPAPPLANGAANGRAGQPARLLAAGLPRHKIVVADDVVESAATLAKLLEACGQEVAVAHDGASAIETINAVHSDLAIVDIGMPGMDGYEVARRLRAAPATRSIVLVALTGYGQEHDRARALAAGFNYHLTKPINVEQLQPLLETH
jgi:signal transduction histidine kinase/CheY-like chemotaxis protein